MKRNNHDIGAEQTEENQGEGEEEDEGDENDFNKNTTQQSIAHTVIKKKAVRGRHGKREVISKTALTHWLNKRAENKTETGQST